jgi:hypothetical protein
MQYSHFVVIFLFVLWMFLIVNYYSYEQFILRLCSVKEVFIT